MANRKRLTVAVGLLSLLSSALARPPDAAALTCAGGAVYFNGNAQTPATDPRGMAASIQAYNPVLCSGGSAAFSSAWVALQGTTSGGLFNILQIGLDKCQAGACPSGNPVGQLYYFWAYGRNAGGPCGVAVPPVALALSGTPSGTPRFKVERAGEELAYHYNVLIDNAIKNYVFIGDVENCWVGGAQDAVFFNEVLDNNTQSGGRFADKQDFDDARYKTGVWNLLTRTLGADCDFIDRPTTQECITSTTDSNNYYTWDSRF